MNWLSDLTAAFPRPRDDEPPELRARIVKELRDHLTCAYRRELVLCGNETEAERRVVDKFGDPRRIARKLWLDAMQEKIMSQRWNLAVSSIMACACLASLAVVIVMTRDNRELNHLLLEQSRTANAALLAELSARREPVAAGPAVSLEWTPVKFRLVQTRRGGQPAEGFKVGLTGNLLDTVKQMVLVKQTGPDGVADFGLVRPGEHNLAITAPWGEFLMETPFVVLPGQAVNRELPSPATPDESASVSCVVDLPQTLRDRNVWLLAEATRGRRNCDGTMWNHAAASARLYFLIAPDGKLLGLPDHLAESASSMMFDGSYMSFDGLTFGQSSMSAMVFGRSLNQDPFFSLNTDYPQGGIAFIHEEPHLYRLTDWQSSAPSPAGSGGRKRHETAWSENGYRPFFLRVADTTPQTELRWPAGRYRIDNLVACEAPTASTRSGFLRYNIIGGLISGGDGQTLNITIDFRPEGMEDDNASEQLPRIPFREWSEALEEPATNSAFEKRETLRAALLPTFDVLTGRANKWELAVPERLTECVALPRRVPEVPTPRVLTDDEPAVDPAPAIRAPRRRGSIPVSPDDEPILVPTLEDDEGEPVRPTRNPRRLAPVPSADEGEEEVKERLPPLPDDDEPAPRPTR